MTQRPCPRCHTVLQFQDEGTLVFCTHCGAPQVTLSEDLLQQASEARAHAEAEADATSEASATSATVPGDPQAAAQVTWRDAIRSSALVATVFSPVLLIVPPIALLVPPLAITLYRARHKETLFTAAVGLRIGLLCGLFSSLTLVFFETAALLLLRINGAGMADFNANLSTILQHSRAQVAAQSGQAPADQVFSLFAISEFRIGMYLGGLALLIAILLALSAAGGAHAGYLRSRTRPATV